MVEVGAWPITTVPVELLPEKSVAPEYTVEIVSLPTGRLEVVTLATPFVMVPVPSDVDPLMNVTVPVGVPVPGLTTTTVALIVTDWPNTGEVGVELMVVAVEAWPTVSTVALEVWPLKLVSPEYCSVIELAPSAARLW